MNRWKIVIFSIIGISLMIAAMLIGQQWVTIYTAVPSTSTKTEPQLHIEYSMEKVGTKPIFVEGEEEGFWILEHYREYEYRYDDKGELVDKRPTDKEEYLRYWQDE